MVADFFRIVRHPLARTKSGRCPDSGFEGDSNRSFVSPIGKAGLFCRGSLRGNYCYLIAIESYSGVVDNSRKLCERLTVDAADSWVVEADKENVAGSRRSDRF